MRAEDLDLRELLSFPAHGGVLRLMGQRAVLTDAVALGLQRKELIASLGVFATRNMVTRLGYAHGWRTGEMLRHEHPDVWAAGNAGPRLPQLTGTAFVARNVRTSGMGDEPLIDSIVEDSFEAEQHLLHLGRSDGPVCWHLVGFASGYLSFKEGREVFFIEDRCVGRGDAHCHISARFKERWGPELEAHLPYFQVQSLDAALTAVTARLRRTERRLRARREELGVYDRKDEVASGIIARSEGMRRALDLARRAARTDSSVVVTGESGVGKELVARLVHRESPRAG
ncbi:MAG TPA: XylR N-terminal domain-containing protein, partial [Anaeromyxobacteraceae bacterium]|nr:XylR N-terminal domain-containing protein [Anaeromyxobacteraceae bacterium]